jgi:hypothetical protein
VENFGKRATAAGALPAIEFAVTYGWSYSLVEARIDFGSETSEAFACGIEDNAGTGRGT